MNLAPSEGALKPSDVLQYNFQINISLTQKSFLVNKEGLAQRRFGHLVSVSFRLGGGFIFYLAFSLFFAYTYPWLVLPSLFRHLWAILRPQKLVRWLFSRQARQSNVSSSWFLVEVTESPASMLTIAVQGTVWTDRAHLKSWFIFTQAHL